MTSLLPIHVLSMCVPDKFDDVFPGGALDILVVDFVDLVPGLELTLARAICHTHTHTTHTHDEQISKTSRRRMAIRKLCLCEGKPRSVCVGRSSVVRARSFISQNAHKNE